MATRPGRLPAAPAGYGAAMASESRDPADHDQAHRDPGEREAADDAEGAVVREGVAEDPVTGSTKTDPSVAETGPPPAGEDPMGGPAPSG